MKSKPKTLSVFKKKKNLFAEFSKKLEKKSWSRYSRYDIDPPFSNSILRKMEVQREL